MLYLSDYLCCVNDWMTVLCNLRRYFDVYYYQIRAYLHLLFDYKGVPLSFENDFVVTSKMILYIYIWNNKYIV